MGISLKRPADMSFRITCHRYSARRRNEIAVLAARPTNKRRVRPRTKAGWIARSPDASSGMRLGERCRRLLKQIGSAIGQAIPFACRDWANTKAAYRFFSNDRVDEEAILSGHFEATHDRFAATEGYVLVLHDTTEFTFKREKPELIGSTCVVNGEEEGAHHIPYCLRDSDAFKPSTLARWWQNKRVIVAIHRREF